MLRETNANGQLIYQRLRGKALAAGQATTPSKEFPAIASRLRSSWTAV